MRRQAKLLVCAIPAVLMILLLSTATATAQSQTRGLFVYDKDNSFGGYTLFFPFYSTTTYLIDPYGRLVHTWDSPYTPGASAYLLENGNLLRTEKIADGGAGAGGRLEEIDWNNNVVWEFEYSNDQYLQHHDIQPMPNGDVLLIAWEFLTEQDAIDNGRDPATLSQGAIWPIHIVEVQPTLPSGGNIVWEWHVWDHLIQDFDSTKANYGVVADHPELVNVNFFGGSRADWVHTNAIDYNPELDQIILSSRQLNEIWIIDHSTTTAEAASHSGGNSGRGGDLLWRWGNPVGYGAGTEDDQRLYGQHDAQWIPAGFPGAGHVLVFNNGWSRPEGRYSTVEELVTPANPEGHYPMPIPGIPYGPDEPAWIYVGDPPTSFFGFNISGAQRLPNGNTLICTGPIGNFFEVTPGKETVWRYRCPIRHDTSQVYNDVLANDAVFRCYRYAADYPGLQVHDLTPSGPLEVYPISIRDVASTPVDPTNYERVDVTAYIDAAPSSITLAQLWADTGSGYFATRMYDDGHHHDGTSNNRVYGASLPAVSIGRRVSYYIMAVNAGDTTVVDPPPAPSVAYDYTVRDAGYICGDADGNGVVNISDGVALVNFIFGEGAAPDPFETGDADCNGFVNISDAVYLIAYIFGGGPVPCASCN